jgi:hypothetical protein
MIVTKTKKINQWRMDPILQQQIIRILPARILRGLQSVQRPRNEDGNALNPPSGIGFFKNTKNSWKNYTLNN